MKKFRILRDSEGKDMPVIIKAGYFVLQGTSIIFEDDDGSFVDEFERKFVKEIFDMNERKVLYPIKK